MFSRLLLTLAAFLPLTFAKALPSTLKRTPNDYTPLSPSPATVQQELGPCLSKKASLYFPSSPNFQNYTQRWSAAVDPDFAVVVIPAVDRDVSCTVKFANKHDVPFLTVNQAHGSASALSNVYNGIEIYISALDSIEIAHDGNSALMGGGTYQDQVVKYLAAHGKVTSTGSCGCVGMMGPGLGGGFGKYQGYFGLVLDNIISMNVVLADGSMSTVSASSMPDLYWGMRGAGHNFGIVTSFNHKIYDDPVIDWFVETMIFTADKLEAFWENMNALGANGTQPVGLVTYAIYAMNPEISKTEPVVILSFQYAGTKAQAEPLYAPFLALNPVVATNVTVPYTGLAHAGGAGVDDPVCAKGLSWKLYPVGLQVYNVTTNRAMYNLYSKMVNDNPAFNNSVVQFEGYSVQAVKAVDPASTAYAHRDDNLLVSYTTSYPPDHSLDPISDTYGKQARAIFHAGDAPGRPLNTYTNYASSDETPEQMYGYEPWRLARLRALKKKYDPKGRFNFYAPINPS